MESQSLILGLIIAVLSILFVVWPFLNLGGSETETPDRIMSNLEVLIERREAIYATIRDLDFDFQTGKLTAEDYADQRQVWVQRGVDVLKAIDSLQQQAGILTPLMNEEAAPQPVSELGDLDAQIEAAVAARRRTV